MLSPFRRPGLPFLFCDFLECSVRCVSHSHGTLPPQPLERPPLSKQSCGEGLCWTVSPEPPFISQPLPKGGETKGPPCPHLSRSERIDTGYLDFCPLTSTTSENEGATWSFHFLWGICEGFSGIRLCLFSTLGAFWGGFHYLGSLGGTWLHPFSPPGYCVAHRKPFTSGDPGISATPAWTRLTHPCATGFYLLESLCFLFLFIDTGGLRRTEKLFWDVTLQN